MRTLLFLLLLAAAPAWAQPATLDPALKRALASPELGKQGATLALLVQGDPAAVHAATQAAGGRVGTQVGDVLTVRVPAGGAHALAATPGVRRLQLGGRYRLRNDAARTATGVAALHAGRAPLARAYTGEGVVVGIIDSGLDVRHLDFRDPDDPSQTRVLAIWDQEDDSGTPPEGYDYGSLYTQADIEAALAGTGSMPHVDADGHGTHVAGTAAGNGAAAGRHTGMAPGADLVVVRFGQSAAAVLDGAAWIFSVADGEGKPAVINASLGTHMGAHDGSTLESVGLDRLVTEKPGRVFVAAAGNENGQQVHWSSTLSGAPAWGLRLSEPEGEMIAFAEVRGSTRATLTLRADAVEIGAGLTPGAAAETIDLHALADGGDFREVYLETGDGEDAAYAEVAASRSGDALLVELYYQDDAEFDGDEVAFWDALRFSLTGDGTAHVWSEGSYPIAEADVAAPTGAGYREWDDAYSVGLPAVSRETIAVGASVNTAATGEAEGDLASFSSLGPTSDGRFKPDLTAPGHGVASALSAQAAEQYAGRELEGGRHVVESGTSMASPVVAGAVALYLQANPDATAGDVREALRASAARDARTGAALPDNRWGWGKLDVLRAVTRTVTAVGDWAVTATADLSAPQPHPVRTLSSVRYSTNQAGAVRLELFDALGRRVRVLADQTRAAGSHAADLEASDLPAGLYLLRLTTPGGTATQALTVAR